MFIGVIIEKKTLQCIGIVTVKFHQDSIPLLGQKSVYGARPRDYHFIFIFFFKWFKTDLYTQIVLSVKCFNYALVIIENRLSLE